MSSVNTKTVQAFYDQFLAGKVEEAANAFLADDFILTNPLPDLIPFGGIYSGAGGFLEYAGKIATTLTMEEFLIDDVISEGEKVVVVGREVSKVHATGRGYEMHWVHVLRVSKDGIHSMREYNDTATMVPAFESDS